MNEKIKSIVNHYWDDSYFEDFDKSGTQRHFLNEFAKHIIRDCAIFSMVITDDHYDVDALFKHFGFEHYGN